MRSKRSRLAIVGVLTLALTATAGLTVGDATAAKKKKKAPTTFVATKTVNAAIPNDNPGNVAETPLTSTITVGKKFKGRVVGDLNVTNLQTTGSADGAADDLTARLIAPNGRTVQLFAGSLGGASIGPLTLDDDTSTSVCDDPTPPCEDPHATLNRPFAGTANLLFLAGGGLGPLSSFNGVPMRGTWTLFIFDDSGGGTTSTLNQWGLQIKRAFPVKP